MIRHRRLIWLAALLVGALAPRALAQEPRAKPPTILRAAWLQEIPNVVAPTLGGKQLWGDELYFGQWRIQRNAVTGHYRLLDPDDVRRTSGSLAVCQRRLEELKKQGHLQPLRGKVVVVLHGLAGGRAQMSPLVQYLEDHSAYEVISVTYPSTRASLADHAAALATIVAGLTEAREIDFVGHSLGNLVVRHYLADCQAATGGRVDPRIKRIVMLGPPNHGSRLAEALGGNVIFDGTLGTSAQQLARRWQELAPHLATPPCEFGIIAGGKGNEIGFNPLLSGDDDGTVRVAETRLAGASDFALVEVIHSLMMANAEVQERTLRFLREGRFEGDGPRHRIAADEESSHAADRGVQVQRRAIADDRK